MPNVLVRDVETTILEKLKIRAARNSRSLQSEVQIILKDAADRAEPLSEIETARKIRTSLTAQKQMSDSAALLREDRSR